MRREIGTYMFCPHPKMPVLSSLIGICAFAESFRNGLAFDDSEFHRSEHLLRFPAAAAADIAVYYSMGARAFQAVT